MRILANGCEMHVSVRGVGHPTLVFLHYFAGSHRAWNHVVSRLELDHRCVAPDLRGFGASTSKRDAYGMNTAASDVESMIAQLVRGPYVLVGHSMGGKIALALAARRPADLEALVLVAPSPPTAEPIPQTERERLLSAHGDELAAAVTADAIVAHALAPALRRQVIEDSVRSSREAWRAWLDRGSREDISALVPNIVVPTLVVSSDADMVIPQALLEVELLSRVRHARLVVLHDVGHLSPLECPAGLSWVIASELARKCTAGQSAKARRPT